MEPLDYLERRRMKPIFFTKMEGTGNDFILLDNREGLISEAVSGSSLTQFVKRLLDRHLGVGSDGLIFLERVENFPFAMRYFNQDGSEAILCLNGARCLVSYAHRLGIVEDKGKFISQSIPVGFYYKDTSISIEVLPPTDIKLNFSLSVKRKKYHAHFLKIGVPHCVIFVDSFDEIDVGQLGQAIRNHKSFKPEGTNVNFVQIKDKSLFVRTYERGIEGETLSCGSGVLSSAYIATKLFMTQSPVIAQTRGGELLATIKDKFYLEGPVNFIFDGVYYI